jgi:N-acetylneuraminate synthase
MRDAPVTIIAEAGVNHNGSLDLALELVDAAAASGADVVKFQTFKAERLASRRAAKAEYQTRTTAAEESQLDMLRRLELTEAHHDAIIARCKQRNIRFLSTPFDTASLDLLVRRFNVDTIKLGSGELTNAPLLLATATTGRPLILSTGMGTLAEVETALGALAFGYAKCADAPGKAAFAEAYADPECRKALNGRVTLLHCTTEYPAPFDETNLRAMDTLSSAFGLPVGFSDHTPGIAVAIAAAARGAMVIEKHMTLDRNLEGPDHKASLEPAEMAAMVASIRQVEAALGDGVKQPAPSEVKNIAIARKSLVAAKAIAAGEPFTPENLVVKRPGNSASPFAYWDLLGQKAQRAYEPDEPIAP